MRSSAVRYIGCCAVLCSLALVLSSCQKPIESKPSGAAVDPQARKVLDDFGKYFASLKGFAVTIDQRLEVSRGGETQAVAMTQTLQAQRPNRLAINVAEAGNEAAANSGAELVSDGVTMTYCEKARDKYLAENAPQSWEAIATQKLTTGNPGDASLVTTALLADDPAAKLLATVETVAYGGVVEIDGVKCHLIKATAEPANWQMWIEVGDKPLVRKFVPDMAKLIANIARQAPGRQGIGDMRMTNTIVCKDWQINPDFAEGRFAFTPPEGAVKVDSMAELLGRNESQREAPHPLLGKPAPPIKVALLGGGQLDLQSLRGKVVILDFWATWCGPCVRAMPIIENVAHGYKDKGVLLYAVNLEEEPADVQKFLDDAGLHVPVALDRDGAVGRAYQASAIPQTVLIGKDGTVQVVHVGLSQNLESELKSEIDALLAGTNLAAKSKDSQEKPPASTADEPATDKSPDSTATPEEK